MARLFEIVSYSNELTKIECESSTGGTVLLVIPPKAYYRMGAVIRSIQQDKCILISHLRMLKFSIDHANHVSSTLGHCYDSEILTTDVTTVMQLDGKVNIKHIRAIVGTPQAHEGAIKIVSDKDSSHALVEYFFSCPKNFPQTAIMNFCSLLIVKPHVLHIHTGEIIDTLLEHDFEISAMESRILDPAFVEEFLDGYKLAWGGYFGESVLDLCSDRSLVIQVRHANVVEKLRELCGPIDPEIARAVSPNSLRARFGIDIVRNAVYCTDLEEDAIRDYWIPLKVRNVFVEQFGSHVSSKGTVVIVREDTRSATDNEKLAFKQLQTMLDKCEEIAQRPPPDDTEYVTESERIKANKSFSQIERHKDRVIGSKKNRSNVKQLRKKTTQFWD